MRRISTALRLCVFAAVTALALVAFPATAFAGNAMAYVNNITMPDGFQVSTGGGTAIFDKSTATLTLNNVKAAEAGRIEVEGTGESGNFTIIVKGDCRFTAVNSAIYTSTAGRINIIIEEGASLQLDAYANAIRGVWTDIRIGGPGSFAASSTSGAHPAIWSQQSIIFEDGVSASIVSASNGIETAFGDIIVDNATLDVNAAAKGLFAPPCDEYYNPQDNSVTFNHSIVRLKTADHGVEAGTRGIDIKASVVYATTGYSATALYSFQDIRISNSSDVTAYSYLGIFAEGKLDIENSHVYSKSNESGLVGEKGINIKGNDTDVEAIGGNNSAILSYEGDINLAGGEVRALSCGYDLATVRCGREGCVTLATNVSLRNDGGGIPVKAKLPSGDSAIILANGYSAYNIHNGKVGQAVPVNGANSTYFALANDASKNAVTGTIETCQDAFGDPVWAWNEDHTAATATFTCSWNPDHIQTVEATVYITTNAPTCEADGNVAHAATVPFNGTEYSTTFDDPLPAEGHKFSNGVCTVCGTDDPDYTPSGGDPDDGDDPDNGDDPDDGDEPDDGNEPGDGNEPDSGDEPGDGNNPDDSDEPGNGASGDSGSTGSTGSTDGNGTANQPSDDPTQGTTPDGTDNAADNGKDAQGVNKPATQAQATPAAALAATGDSMLLLVGAFAALAALAACAVAAVRKTNR